jgi:hypothetical protein
MKPQRLFSKRFNSFAEWNGSGWEDNSVLGAYFYTLEKAANNGYYPVKEKSDLEKAIEWWNSIPVFEKGLLIHDTFNPPLNQRTPEEVTGREIEQIWRRETQQKSSIEIQADKVEEITFKNLLKKEKRPQVDFELLSLSVIAVSSNLKLTKTANLNLKLFFELLSKSSTFAHKAHKELNKLTK